MKQKKEQEVAAIEQAKKEREKQKQLQLI